MIRYWFLVKSIGTSPYLMFLVFQLVAGWSQGAAVKIGNGDNGADLEGAVELHDGPIVESRDQAVELLRSLNVQGVVALGLLIPEVEKAPIYMAERDINTEFEEISSFEVNRNGYIYAKTFPEPHSPTRFFPISKQLASADLVALHIHEGLHRALPKSMRENEKIVSRITLAITAPGSNNDRIARVVEQNMTSQALYEIRQQENQQENRARGVDVVTRYDDGIENQMPMSNNMKRPTLVGYQLHAFQERSEDSSPDRSLSLVHLLTSHLYPFGRGPQALGVGVRLSLIQREQDYILGPVDVSGRMKLWTLRGFDVDGFGSVALNPLAASEMSSQIPGRDVVTLGLAMKKDVEYFYVENLLSFSTRSTVEQSIGRVNYRHEFGSGYGVKLRMGGRWKNLSAGGFADVQLADGYRVTGGSFAFDDIGRFRIVSVGPELKWDHEHYQVGFFGKTILDRTDGINFDYLGNLMGQGKGEAMLGMYMDVRL